VTAANDWRSGASPDLLRQRAKLLGRIRAFFADRLVMEVETPVLAAAGVTDPQLENLETGFAMPGDACVRRLYLQTSPEYAMKRLLASDCGPIYQICKVFRNGEAGRLHNPEFTMVEWYRPGFGYRDIMEDTEDLLIYTLGIDQCRHISYRAAFLAHAGLDPFDAADDVIGARAASLGLDAGSARGMERDDFLDFILSEQVAPQLGRDRPVFLCEYPASQAALARIIEAPGAAPVAARFEVFIQGMEIANGFEELTDGDEQRRRFERDNARRRALGRKEKPLDERLLGALAHGLPDCAGVALGLDRLLMVQAGRRRLDEVLAFPLERA
jgi:lysyl-tRNA synthetase class 2